MKLTDFPKETKLGEDLAKYAKQFKREVRKYLYLVLGTIGVIDSIVWVMINLLGGNCNVAQN